MPGIRLHHPTLHSCVLVCPTDEWSGNPHLCHMCNEIHPIRTLHLRLDPRGDVIVGSKIFRRLKRAGLAHYGLEIANEVKRPPAQTVSLAVPPQGFRRIEMPRPAEMFNDPNPRRSEEGAGTPGDEGKRLERLTVPGTVRDKGDYKHGK